LSFAVPSPSAIVFPFRRLAIWLGVLVLAVTALALGISALIVLPSLERNLVDRRVQAVEKQAKSSAVVFEQAIQGPTATQRDVPTLDDAVAALERLTPARIVVFQALREDALFAKTDSMPELARDPIALAAVGGEFQSGTVRDGSRWAAEAAYPIGEGDRMYVVLYSQSLADVKQSVDLVERRILIAVAIAAPLAWLVGALAAMALVARIRRLERASRRIATGEFDHVVRDGGRDEIAQLARAFDEMRQRLERTDRARREFIANASHELRTPLFTLGGFLELLEDPDIDDETREEFLATMRDQVARLTRLATDLLDLSRLDAESVALEREPVDLGEVAATLANDFAPVGERRASTVVTTAPAEGAPRALADTGRVMQIGRALVDNALRHNPRGTRIEIDARAESGRTVLVVRDDGPAIPAAIEPRLFERFFRGPGGGEGSGLGLAIAHELAQRMGGRLELEQDAVHKEFRLTLPAASVPQAVPTRA
jgi:signal transduction histidine kinase